MAAPPWSEQCFCEGYILRCVRCKHALLAKSKPMHRYLCKLERSTVSVQSFKTSRYFNRSPSKLANEGHTRLRPRSEDGVYILHKDVAKDPKAKLSQLEDTMRSVCTHGATMPSGEGGRDEIKPAHMLLPSSIGPRLMSTGLMAMSWKPKLTVTLSWALHGYIHPASVLTAPGTAL